MRNFRILPLTKKSCSNRVKNSKMGRTCSIFETDEKYVHILIEILAGEDHLVTCSQIKIILKKIFNN
jgi:hypothetical protein